MAIGDFDPTPLISQAVITGGWPAIPSTSQNSGFCHATADIYCIGFGRDSTPGRDLFVATVRVTGTGVITAASLDFISLGLSDPPNPKIELHKLSDGVIVAFHCSESAAPGLSVATFSVDNAGNITLLDGPDVLDASFVSGSNGMMANKVADGVWGVQYPLNDNTIHFLTVDISNSGTIGSILDGPDDAGAVTVGLHAGFIYLDQNVAIRADTISPNGRAETFTLNESSGIFNVIVQLDQLTMTTPDLPFWFSHVALPADRRVFVLGRQDGGGGLAIAHLSINGSDDITSDDTIDVADSDGIDLGGMYPLTERKVFFMGGGTDDSCFVYQADVSGNLSQHDLENALGLPGGTYVGSARAVTLEGSGDSKLVVGSIDLANDVPRVIVIGVQLPSSGQAIWHGYDF